MRQSRNFARECRAYSVKSSTEGILFARNADCFARTGRIIAKIAGKEPLREAGGNLLTLEKSLTIQEFAGLLTFSPFLRALHGQSG
jgi:hypothetical protein